MRPALVAAAICALYVPLVARATVPSDFHPTVINWHLSANEIKSTCSNSIARARAAMERIAQAPGSRTFSNTVLALENLNADLSDSLAAQTFLSQIGPDKDIRKVSLACSNSLSAFGADQSADPRLYRAVLAAKESNTARTVYDRALMHVWLQGFVRSGAALPSARRAEFVKLSKELTTLQNSFDENYANVRTTIEISKDEADGLPPDFLSTLKATDAGYSVPVTGTSNAQFMSNAKSEAARKRFFIAYGNLAVPQNDELLKKAVNVRTRLARLLGFDSWAAYQLDNRVDRSPRHIMRFLTDLDAHVMPSARADIAELARMKAQDTGATGSINPWDVAYYLNLTQKQKYSFDPQVIRQYFPAPHVAAAVMDLYQNILGLTFTQIKPANNWYSDVTEFAVSDASSGKFIGTFMLDLYPRDGKPGGAYDAPVIPVRRMADGRYRPPVSVLQVSDWPAAVSGKPALLTHDDVVVFFHEFGHNMAALLAQVPYESLAQFPQDFVEAPSQMLENFMWAPSIIKKISSNVDTGLPLPDDLINKLVKARCSTDRLCNGYMASRQLLYSIADLKIHTEGPNVDTTAIWASVARTYTPMPIVPGTHPEAQFTHLMSGYDAGYYTYLWSLVYAQDMFTAFQKGGLESPQVGMRYRRTILAPARTFNPNLEVQNFLGRPMNPAAFYAGFTQKPR